MDSSEQQHQYFSLSEGGPAHSLLCKMHVYQNRKKLLLFFFCITWLPLLILSAIEGTCFTGIHPFLEDIAMQIRFLLALPMLLLLGSGIDARVIAVKRYVSETLMSGEEQQRVFARIVRDSRKLAWSTTTELVLLLIVVAITIGHGKGGLLVGSTTSGTWMFATIEGKNVLSHAGQWAVFFSIPIFQFMVLRGFWRYIVWSIMLFRFSNANMDLQATHPDKAAGLGILMLAQKSFCSFFIAISIVASGELIARLLADPNSFGSIRKDGLGYIILFVVLIFLPLLFFIKKLIMVKEEGLIRLSRTGTNMSHRFERDWVNDLSIENKVEDAVVDPSTMQDYDTVFVSLEEMQMVPFALKDVIVITIMLFLPYLPIIVLHFSVAELLERLLGLLM